MAEKDIHLWSAARLFALLAIDNFDALISGWDAKYAFEYWRPVTAIHNADADGMPASRSYESIDAAVESCGMSRIYNGFHFRSGVEIGTEMGRDRARHILDTQLVRLPETASDSEL